MSKVALAVMVCFGMSGCSLENDSSTEVVVEPINEAPVINLSDTSIAEKLSLTVSSSVTDDGTIAKYEWSQVSGTEVAITGADSAEFSFVAPSVIADENLVFSLTATDDEGAATTASVTITITQVTNDIKLTGLVTDGPIANAEVTVVVGTQETKVIADANGQYEVELAIDDDISTDMVSIVAQGVETQGRARLISILGDVETLLSLANADGVLSSDELSDVNVTNLTTAKVALMQLLNNGNDPQDQASLVSLASKISLEQLFTLATAIKVAIDKAPDNAELALPDGIVDTLDLVSDVQASKAYISLIKTSDEYVEAIQEILNDSNIFDESIFELAQVLYFAQDGIAINLAAADAEQGKMGEILDNDGSTFFSYTTTPNSLVVSFGDTPYIYELGTEEQVINGEPTEVTYEITISSVIFSLDTLDSISMTLESDFSGLKRYPENSQLSAEEVSFQETHQAITASNIIDFSIDEGMTTDYALPLPLGFFTADNLDILTIEQFTFEPNNTGVTRVSEQSFTWNYVGGEASSKQQVSVVFENGASLLYTQLTNSSSAKKYAVLLNDDQAERLVIADGGEIESEDGFDLASMPGIYELQEGMGENLYHFWFELWPTGKAYTVSTFDNDNNGIISQDEVYVQYGDWSVDEDGELDITRWNEVNNPNGSGCFGELDARDYACYLFNSRLLKRFAVDGDAYGLTNFHRFDLANQGSFDYLQVSARKLNKIDQRPLNAQRDNYLPSLAPAPFFDLSSPSEFLDTDYFLVDANNTVSGSIASLNLSGDGTFNLKSVTSDAFDINGAYITFEDNVMRFTEAQRLPRSFAFLMDGDDFQLVAFDGSPILLFATQEQAQFTLDAINNRTAVKSVTSLVDLQNVLIDRDQNDEFTASYLMFSAESISIYTDNTYTEVVATIPYSINEDGSIDINGGQNSLYIAADSGALHVFMTYEEDGSVSENYLISDVTQAEQLLKNLKQLGADKAN